ncbi:MAG: septum formation initiator family protein [Candidatus Pacebacteria bacterium]|nr:septum formation initiator family protein [Candidatus Paceibacterota bacterium]
MRWKKILTIIILGLLLFFIGEEAIKDYLEYKKYFSESEKLKADISVLEKKNKDLEKDIEYFNDPYNLEKELKSKFNYKKEGEKMIIIVPDE